MTVKVAFVSGEEDGTPVAAAGGEEFGTAGGERADGELDVEGRGVEARVAEAVEWC